MNEQTGKQMGRDGLATWMENLCCPQCAGGLQAERGETLLCAHCDEAYPISGGIPQMISTAMRRALAGEEASGEVDERRVETANSFGYEWNHFPEMRAEWEKNF